ncbi:MAG: hypothetical protein AAFV69_14465 [Pseudomonadota bacterium]
MNLLQQLHNPALVALGASLARRASDQALVNQAPSPLPAPIGLGHPALIPGADMTDKSQFIISFTRAD